MGWGDELTVTGQARVAQQRDPRPVIVLDRNGRPRWHPLWQGSPRIARPEMVAAGLAVQTVTNGPRARPYIDYGRMRAECEAAYPGQKFSTKIRDVRLPWRFKPGMAPRGELYIEPADPGGTVVIEPIIKPGASPNKDWGWARWQALVQLRPDLDWVQLGPAGTRLLTGVRHIPTPDFLAACKALSGACAAVLPEGGLHHAAAAMAVPAVVIYGGFIAPSITGHAGQIALYRPHEAGPCGQRVPCRGCQNSMASIAPDEVASCLEELLCWNAKASSCPTAKPTSSGNCATSARTRR